ncbi:hypothetical protein LguiB_013394 [Lonicera macranthoides]
MAVSRYLLRSPTIQTLKSLLPPLRSLSSTTTPDPDHHHNHHQQNHEYLSPNNYINSWNPPKNPREAELQLVKLRREYAKKVKEVRKEYIQEMELQRIEKQIKDEKKKEALRIANEERKAAKAAVKKAKAAERQVAEEEFRQTLKENLNFTWNWVANIASTTLRDKVAFKGEGLKERMEKLEYWRKRVKQVEEKKKEKNELIRRQSSIWIEEEKLGKKIFEAVVDGGALN